MASDGRWRDWLVVSTLVALQVLVKLLAGETVVAFLVGGIGFDFAFVLGTVVVAAVCVLCFVPQPVRSIQPVQLVVQPV